VGIIYTRVHIHVRESTCHEKIVQAYGKEIIDFFPESPQTDKAMQSHRVKQNKGLKVRKN